MLLVQMVTFYTYSTHILLGNNIFSELAAHQTNGVLIGVKSTAMTFMQNNSQSWKTSFFWLNLKKACAVIDQFMVTNCHNTNLLIYPCWDLFKFSFEQNKIQFWNVGFPVLHLCCSVLSSIDLVLLVVIS